MDPAVVVAMIALVGTLANVGVTYLLNARSERRRAAQKADLMWSQYRESIASAAYDLAMRIENILRHEFLEARGDAAHKDEAVLSTMFRFAQYFGWSEIIRRAGRVPDPRVAAETRQLLIAMSTVSEIFTTDQYGPGGFTVWREAQRAIGELVITRDGEVIDTLGVAGFMEQWENIRPWLHRAQRLIESTPLADWNAGERARLDAVYAGLIEVVAASDPDLGKFLKIAVKAERSR
jgi:hypothetical protein